MKTNPLTLHLVLERSHSNLVLFHVDIAAITQTKQRMLRGGHAAVTHNFSVCGAAAWFQLMLHLFFGPEAEEGSMGLAEDLQTGYSSSYSQPGYSHSLAASFS